MAFVFADVQSAEVQAPMLLAGVAWDQSKMDEANGWKEPMLWGHVKSMDFQLIKNHESS